MLLDVEGTTTPIAFVHDGLFPYARKRLRDYVQRHAHEPEMAADIEALRRQHEADMRAGLAPPRLSMDHDQVSPADDSNEIAGTLIRPVRRSEDDRDIARIVAYLEWLMDHDRKVGPLKSIQGRIWEDGYRSGALRGEVFPDVPPFLQSCRGRSIEARIYSSGSVLAQKLIFGFSEAGDLTPLIAGHYDTAVGAKTDPASYARIVSDWRLPAGSVLFVSDVVAELDAAAAAGLATRLCVRPGNIPQPPSIHPILRSLEDLFPL